MSACGDKFLLVGRDVRFQRADAAIHPGSILIVLPPKSVKNAAVRDSRLQMAGHRVELVLQANLADQVGGARYDIILAIPDHCGACASAISYNSCRNRHCPKCQAQARARWLAARQHDVLDVSYVHVVFTLPHALLALGYRNARRLYTWLFQASAATLLEVAANPRHLGAEIGVLATLHVGTDARPQPDVHCVVPAGGLSPVHHRWIRPNMPASSCR